MKQSLLFVLVLSSIVSACGRVFAGEQDTVAIVGAGNAITFGELRTRVHDRSYDRMYETKPRDVAFKVCLGDMIADQLKRIDFFALGLQHDSTLLQGNRRIISEELSIQYYEREYLRKYVNAKAIHDAYAKMKREVVCRRFFVDSTAIDRTKAHDSFMGIAEKLEKERAQGKSYDELVATCRRWLAGRGNTGVTDTVTWKKSLGNESSAIIFGLNAGSVRILMSPMSLEIVEITKIRNIPVKPFAEVQDEIYNTLRQMYAYKSFDEYKEARAKLIDEKSVRWNTEGLDKVFSWANSPRFFGGLYADTLAKALADGRNFTILRYRDGTVDVKGFLRLLNDVLILPNRAHYSIADLKTYFLEALRSDKVLKKARALGLEADIFNANTRDPDLKDRIVILYNRREIESKVPPLTEARAREFYAANKDSLYYQLAKSYVYAIITPDKKRIDSLWQMHEQGAPFEKLSHNYFVKGFVRDRGDSIIRSSSSSETPFLGKAAFALTLNQVAGPIRYEDPNQGTQYAIIKCVEQHPEKQLTFDEAQKSMPNDFKQYEMKRIEEKTVERLKAKYGFTIYDDVLTRNLSAPTQK